MSSKKHLESIIIKNKLKIWLIKAGEPVPVKRKDYRLMRTGLMAKIFSEKNANVTWITSTFFHQKKETLFDKDTIVTINKNYKIFFIKTPEYKKNISFKRLINHRILAKSFLKKVKVLEKPDIIVLSYPPMRLCVEVEKFAKEQNIPVILDIRDLWPEDFANLIPVIPFFIKRILLFYPYYIAAKIFKNAFAITSITDEIINWAFHLSGITNKPNAAFPHGYFKVKPNKLKIKNNIILKYTRDKKQKDFYIVFFGMLSEQFNIDYIISIAEILYNVNKNIKFFIFGDGPRKKEYLKKTINLKNIFIPGYITQEEIRKIMQKSDLGVAPYIGYQSFNLSVPNKVIEYMSGGLPILSSISGVVGNLIQKNNCGYIYDGLSPKETADLIIKIYNNPKELKIKSKNALNLFNEKYKAEKVYADYYNYIQMIVKQYKISSEKKLNSGRRR
ncbi:MAG: glycosyltransferase family 4 protein [Spirochaetia bacterium]|nr:glycosyltransferase family 4 protein [Spirochaetia bacterium]